MSLFGSMLNDMDDDPFFGAQMRQMRQMNNMMNSLFSDPFGMLGGGGLALMGPQHGSSLMPFMPQMPQFNLGRLMAGGYPSDRGGSGSMYSSSTVVMSSGPNGNPQVYSQTSRTKVGPNGVKETLKTVEDSRTGTRKMAIGHHIGERAHVVEKEKNVYTGDEEERQDFINLDEDELDDFDQEYQEKASAYTGAHRGRLIAGPGSRAAPQLALTAPPAPSSTATRRSHQRPTARRPIRQQSSPLALTPSSSASVREVYSSAHPQRHKQRAHKSRASPDH